jgi:hypothetical protein
MPPTRMMAMAPIAHGLRKILIKKVGMGLDSLVVIRYSMFKVKQHGRERDDD